MANQGKELIPTEALETRSTISNTKDVQEVDDHLTIEFTEIKKEQTEYFENNMYNLQNQR